MATEYDAEIADLERQETELRQQRKVLEQRRAESLCPFEIGDVIVKKGGWEQGTKAVVAIIETYNENYVVTGVRLRKDGSRGERSIKIYYWESWEKEIDKNGK